jgi:hypothetical protein
MGRAGNSRNRLETGHSALRGIASAPPEPALRQTLQQRLRLGDLWQFRCRGEAFERGREDGVSVSRAAGRLVEFRERQGRAQFEAARSLLTRDGDCRVKGFFCRRSVGAIALEQYVAADAVWFR